MHSVRYVKGNLDYLGDPRLFTMPCEVSTVRADGTPECNLIQPQGDDLTGLLHPSVDVDSASFFAATISQRFIKASFRHTTFQEANLSGCVFEYCDFVDCALDFSNCSDTAFVGCTIDASFGAANLSRATFTDCTIHGDFCDSNLERTRFENCELEGSFAGTHFSTISFVATTANDVGGDTTVIERLLSAGLRLKDQVGVEFDWDPTVFEPEPSDELEAWYQRWSRFGDG